MDPQWKDFLVTLIEISRERELCLLLWIQDVDNYSPAPTPGQAWTMTLAEDRSPNLIYEKTLSEYTNGRFIPVGYQRAATPRFRSDRRGKKGKLLLDERGKPISVLCYPQLRQYACCRYV